MNVWVFQDTKLTEVIYTRRLAGYRAVATPALSRHQGGVALLYWESPAFAFEVIRQFGANAIAFHLATGEGHWNIVGCYLAPGDGMTIQDVEAAMAYKAWGAELVVAGDLNVELGKEGVQGRDK